jgi:hypothetical protein
MTHSVTIERISQEAVRLYRRYQLEIVEACGLCPWAQRARLDDRLRIRVVAQAEPRGTEPSLAAIDALIADERADVAVLIYPRLHLGRLEFERFVSEVRDADAPRHPLGCIPFVFAAFHPDAQPDTSDAERLIPFLRRSPDPTVQVLRSGVLDKVRSSTPQGTQFMDLRMLEELDVSASAAGEQVSLRQRIARTNLATVHELGLAEVTRRIEAIAEDRRSTYRAIESAGGVPASPSEP